jgi:hypothetical protein
MEEKEREEIRVLNSKIKIITFVFLAVEGEATGEYYTQENIG